MKLTDFVADVPDDVWAVFEPILPPVVWKGVGCKPYGNRQCLHALLYVLIAGIGWQFLPQGPGSSWPNATGGCTASTGIRSSSTAPRSRQKKGGRHGAFSRGST
jgi:hypothetical protein